MQTDGAPLGFVRHKTVRNSTVVDNDIESKHRELLRKVVSYSAFGSEVVSWKCVRAGRNQRAPR